MQLTNGAQVQLQKLLPLIMMQLFISVSQMIFLGHRHLLLLKHFHVDRWRERLCFYYLNIMMKKSYICDEKAVGDGPER